MCLIDACSLSRNALLTLFTGQRNDQRLAQVYHEWKTREKAEQISNAKSELDKEQTQCWPLWSGQRTYENISEKNLLNNTDRNHHVMNEIKPPIWILICLLSLVFPYLSLSFYRALVLLSNKLYTYIGINVLNALFQAKLDENLINLIVRFHHEIYLILRWQGKDVEASRYPRKQGSRNSLS